MKLDNEEKIVNILNNSGVITFVTDTVWGLGCIPTDEKAVKKIYEIKKREAQKPLILMSNDIKYLKKYIEPLSQQAEELVEKYFPGALTIVSKKTKNTPDFVTSNLDTVGIRIPNNEVFRRICEITPDHVLATTSANLSHQPSAKTYKQAFENMKDLADIVIEDYGHSAKGLESTVVGVYDNKIKIFRQGEIFLEEYVNKQ